jgi:hypothetical protein
MSNSGCLWDNEEDLQLIKLYVKYKLNTSFIADIHKRSIKSIELRVIKLGLSIPENKESETLKDNNFIWEMAIEQDKLQRMKGILPNPNKFQFFTEIISKVITQNDICNKQIISNLEKRINELEKNQLNSLD